MANLLAFPGNLLVFYANQANVQFFTYQTDTILLPYIPSLRLPSNYFALLFWEFAAACFTHQADDSQLKRAERAKHARFAVMGSLYVNIHLMCTVHKKRI